MQVTNPFECRIPEFSRALRMKSVRNPDARAVRIGEESVLLPSNRGEVDAYLNALGQAAQEVGGRIDRRDGTIYLCYDPSPPRFARAN